MVWTFSSLRKSCEFSCFFVAVFFTTSARSLFAIDSAQPKQWFQRQCVFRDPSNCKLFQTSFAINFRALFLQSLPFARKTNKSDNRRNHQNRSFCAVDAPDTCFPTFLARTFWSRHFLENVKKWNPSSSQGIRVSAFGISPVCKEKLSLRTLKNGPPEEIVAVCKEYYTWGPKCC